MRSWTATAGAVMALGLAPVAIVTMASPAVSWADVCVTGQVLNNVGVCVDAGMDLKELAGALGDPGRQ